MKSSQATVTRTVQEPLEVNPNLPYELQQLGAEELSRCYDCGTCTAICPLSEEGSEFPRNLIRYAIAGLEKKILSLPTPWLCYYCGDCSLKCPKDAKPAGFMMALRRYLTMRYDWTGFSRLLYVSRKVEILSVALLAVFASLLIYFLQGPVMLDRVELATFAPLEVVEAGGIAVFIILTLSLSINIFRMYRSMMPAETAERSSLSLGTYVSEFLRTVPKHFFTQSRLGDCDDREFRLSHTLTFVGYISSFILFFLLLSYTQTNAAFLFYDPLSVLGLFATGAILLGAGVAIRGRLRKTLPVWESSHPTDWLFITMMIVVTVSGVLTGIFRSAGFPLATYVTYSAHLVTVAIFLLLEVPFAKWSHIAYRPFAMYFARLRELKVGGVHSG